MHTISKPVKPWNLWFFIILSWVLYFSILGYFIYFSIDYFTILSRKSINNITLYNNYFVGQKEEWFEPVAGLAYFLILVGTLAFCITGITTTFYEFNDHIGLKVKASIVSGCLLLPTCFMIVFASSYATNSLNGKENITIYEDHWSGYSETYFTPELNCESSDAKVVYDGNFTAPNCTTFEIPGTYETFTQCCGLWHYSEETIDMIVRDFTFTNVYFEMSLIGAFLLDMLFSWLQITDLTGSTTESNNKRKVGCGKSLSCV